MAASLHSSWTDESLQQQRADSHRHHEASKSLSASRTTLRPHGSRKVSAKRKRMTGDPVSNHPLQSSPAGPHPTIWIGPLKTPNISTKLNDFSFGPSPSPLANENYFVANGYDTPGMTITVLTVDYARETPDLKNFRCMWGAEKVESYGAATVTPSIEDVGKNDGEKKARAGDVQQLKVGGLGGVASRVISFCSGILPTLSSAESVHDASTLDDFDTWRRSATPLPGRYPEDDADSPKEAANEVTSRRSAKRLHTGSGNDWIMVDRDEEEDNMPRISQRKISSSLAQVQTPPTHTTASRANSRQSMGLKSRKSISHINFNGSPASLTPPVLAPEKRRASMASTRSPNRTLRTRRSQQQLTPRRSIQDLAKENDRSSLSPQAHKYLRQRDKRERDADKSMRNMSRQVQELIRQGQQALGSRFDVECGEDSDERVCLEDR